MVEDWRLSLDNREAVVTLVVELMPGGALNFWVGMCRWDPGTLNLYHSGKYPYSPYMAVPPPPPESLWFHRSSIGIDEELLAFFSHYLEDKTKE